MQATPLVRRRRSQGAGASVCRDAGAGDRTDIHSYRQPGEVIGALGYSCSRFQAVAVDDSRGIAEFDVRPNDTPLKLARGRCAAHAEVCPVEQQLESDASAEVNDIGKITVDDALAVVVVQADVRATDGAADPYPK